MHLITTVYTTVVRTRECVCVREARGVIAALTDSRVIPGPVCCEGKKKKNPSYTSALAVHLITTVYTTVVRTRECVCVREAEGVTAALTD